MGHRIEELNIEEIPKDSPTCTKESLRLVLSIIVQNGWMPHSIDIKTAFLQGHLLDRNAYVKPPADLKLYGKVWKLRKCVYSLSDASLYWYDRVKSVMIDMGANMSKVDPAVFYWLNEKREVIGIVASHVDDFIWSGRPDFEKSVVDKIRTTFCVGKGGQNMVVYFYIKRNT